MLSRPFEFVLVLAGLAVFRIPRRSLLIAALALLPACGLTLLQNKAVTGSWTELPYTLSRYQYGIPTTFRFQAVPRPHRPLTTEQQIDYERQSETHERKAQFAERLPFLRFFVLAPLFVAAPFFLRWIREPQYLRVLAVLAILWIGTGFYPYFYPHYIAVATCLFVLISVKGLESLALVKQEAAALVMALCLAHFLFWYGVRLAGSLDVEIATARFESTDVLNSGDPGGRIAINRHLAAAPGKQLVFVRYSGQHGENEWIHNAANIDEARVVWALDLGPEEDAKLRQYYPDRTAWLLEPDVRPIRLMPQSATGASPF